ncbi:MAG: ABC transporter ATP-binding protein [Clostridia bacterium]|nr:ABC transporter ATP-binding protein [Clostridia bacterium]
MSLLTVQNLSFSYGTREIFSGVSFAVEQGQIFCLVGPNGCGKTTLQHCLLGHLRPQSGSVLIEGKPLTDHTPRDLAAQLAFVPQSHSRSFPYQTVDVVALGRTRRRKPLQPGGDEREQALAVMERLGIAHLAETEYTTLSGGELQMVLLARALAQESAMLVLDEPAAHLDVRRAQGILLLLAQIAKEQGRSILLSTHDFNHPLFFEDEGADVKMALMEGGRLGRAGRPLELLSSGCLKEVYGIESRVVTVKADKERHYLAAWAETDRGKENI